MGRQGFRQLGAPGGVRQHARRQDAEVTGPPQRGAHLRARTGGQVVDERGGVAQDGAARRGLQR
ncbi:MAG: hypothetical protein WD250_15470 [Egibacteraceae bacterium]